MPLQGHLPVSTGTMAQRPDLSPGQILKHLIKQGFHPCTMPLLQKSTFVLYYISKIFIMYVRFILCAIPNSSLHSIWGMNGSFHLQGLLISSLRGNS